MLAEIDGCGERALIDEEVVNALRATELRATGGGVVEAEAEIVEAIGGLPAIFQLTLVGERGRLSKGDGCERENGNGTTNGAHVNSFRCGRISHGPPMTTKSKSASLMDPLKVTMVT